MLRRHFTNVTNTGGTEEEIETTFYIESLEDGNTVHFSPQTWLGGRTRASLVYYSYNKIDWIKLSSGLKVTINANERLYLKGNGISDLQKSSSIASTLRELPLFWVFKPYKVGGNLKELINPSDNMQKYAYTYFFEGECIYDASKLILPELSLADSCYACMFYNCTLLTKAPKLPATTLVNKCYYEMFYNCALIKEIFCNAIENVGGTGTNSWLMDASTNGTFYKNPNATWPIGVSGIPEGWTVQDYVE